MLERMSNKQKHFLEPADFAAHSSQKRFAVEAVQQTQVNAAPNQRNNLQQAAEKIGHRLGEVVVGRVGGDQDNEVAAGIRKVEGQLGGPTAEGQKACIHHRAVGCSHLEALMFDSAQASAKPAI